MNTKIILLSVFALVYAVSCSEKEAIPETTGNSVVPVKITGNFASKTLPVLSAPVSRADFVDPTPANPATATWDVRWKVGDEIRVFNQTGSENTVIYEVTAVNPSTGEATFELKAGEDVSKFGESTVFYAAHGGKSSAGYSYLYDENVIATGLETYKSIYKETIDNSFFITIAKATLTGGDLSFVFHNVTSYLRIEIPSGMEYNVGEFYFSGTSHPSGYFTVTFESEGTGIEFIGARTGGGSNNLPIWYGEGTASVTKPYPQFPEGVYYVPIRPGATLTKLVVRDLNNNNKKTQDNSSNGKSFTIVHGTVYDLGTLPTTAD